MKQKWNAQRREGKKNNWCVAALVLASTNHTFAAVGIPLRFRSPEIPKIKIHQVRVFNQKSFVTIRQQKLNSHTMDTRITALRISTMYAIQR